MKSIVNCDSTAGSFKMELRPDWAPLGAQRVAELVRAGWFDGVTLNRVNPNFLVQFGIRPPGLNPHLKPFSSLQDDPRLVTLPDFTDGIVSFAGSGPNSRQSQLFITFGTQKGLGHAPWEVPVGKVSRDDMLIVRQFYSGYGDMPPWGHGPSPQRMAAAGGQAYLDSQYPLLSKIIHCRIQDTTSPPIPSSQLNRQSASSVSAGKIYGLGGHSLRLNSGREVAGQRLKRLHGQTRHYMLRDYIFYLGIFSIIYIMKKFCSRIQKK